MLQVIECKPVTTDSETQQPSDLNSPTDYVRSEIESLERCLRRLDERAMAVEWSLRHAMKVAAASDSEGEEKSWLSGL